MIRWFQCYFFIWKVIFMQVNAFNNGSQIGNKDSIKTRVMLNENTDLPQDQAIQKYVASFNQNLAEGQPPTNFQEVKQKLTTMLSQVPELKGQVNTVALSVEDIGILINADRVSDQSGFSLQGDKKELLQYGKALSSAESHNSDNASNNIHYTDGK